MKLWIPVLLFLVSLPLFGVGCDSVVGDWKWFNGGVVTFQQNNGLMYDGRVGGKWECTNPARGAITLRWSSGFTDMMTVTGDRMSGKNQKGITVSAVRRATPKPKPAH